MIVFCAELGPLGKGPGFDGGCDFWNMARSAYKIDWSCSVIPFLGGEVLKIKCKYLKNALDFIFDPYKYSPPFFWLWNLSCIERGSGRKGRNVWWALTQRSVGVLSCLGFFGQPSQQLPTSPGGKMRIKLRWCSALWKDTFWQGEVSGSG